MEVAAQAVKSALDALMSVGDSLWTLATRSYRSPEDDDAYSLESNVTRPLGPSGYRSSLL